MELSELKQVIDFENISKEKLLECLITLGNQLNQFPVSLMGIQDQITSGEAFAIAMLTTTEKQWNMSLGGETYQSFASFVNGLSSEQLPMLEAYIASQKNRNQPQS
jgi:hypothetical protein